MDDGRPHWPSSLDFSWNASIRSCLLPILVKNESVDGDNKATVLKEIDGEKKNGDLNGDDDECSTTNHDDSIDASSCYLCTHCGKGCSTERELNYHISTEHDEELDGDSPTDNDNNKSSADYQYACKLCPRTFLSSSTLNVHYTHTHRDKPQYDCEICGQCFSVKRELATHKRLHDGQPTHRCRQCGKEFGTKQLLRKHELWHTGERAHVCPHPQCGKAFFQKGHLTQHLMIHAGGRPHACHLCPKTFIFKFDLNRHMKIHAERGNSSNNVNTSNGELVATSPQAAVDESVQIVDDNNADQRTNTNHTAVSLLTPMFRRRRHLLSNCSNNARSPIDDVQSNNNAFVSESHNQNAITDDSTNALQQSETASNREAKVEGEVSPSTNSSVYSTANLLLNNYACCEKCVDYRNQLETSRRCVAELETILVQRHREIEALKWKVQRVGEVAGNLLETCSEFDKLWMLHSKKVYSQMQNVLSTLQ